MKLIRKYKELLFLLFLLFDFIRVLNNSDQKVLPVMELYYFIPLIISLIFYRGQRGKSFFILLFLYIAVDLYSNLIFHKVYNVSSKIPPGTFSKIQIELMVEEILLFTCYMFTAFSFIRNNPFFLYLFITSDKIYKVIYFIVGLIFAFIALFFIWIFGMDIYHIIFKEK